jgi:TolB-like protein
MLASATFGRSERAARFLHHLVETTLRGESQLLKESLLGTEVFDREPTWDPRLDPVVRQEAARLRKRIARYYETENPGATLHIEIPVGTYVPVFHLTPGPADFQPVVTEQPPAPVLAAGRQPPNIAWWVGAGVLAAVLGTLAAFALSRSWFAREEFPPAEADRSIAVIPFANEGAATAADQYFVDGLTDEITDTLTQQRRLRVVARSSVFQYRGKIIDVREVGRELGVAYVLEGTVQRLGDRVKINARLGRVSDATQVWSKTWERQGGDLFAVRSELASAITSSLQASVGGQPPRKHAAGERAHDLYMQGRYELEQMTPQSLDRAAETLQQAIDRDPQYAAAYYALGQAKWSRSSASASQVVDPARRESVALFRRALELDPDLAEAHAGLAGDPSVAVENSYAFLLVFQNRFAEADEHIRRSQELDPVGAVSVANRALLWNLEGRFRKSREEFQRMLEKSPDLVPERYMVALTFIEEGNPAASAPILHELGERTPVARMFQAMAVARAGRKKEALSLIAPFEAKYPDPGVANQWFALVYAFLGDQANTVKWLGRSIDRHEWQALNLAVHPVYASMRNSAGFEALKKRIGLDQPERQ